MGSGASSLEQAHVWPPTGAPAPGTCSGLAIAVSCPHSSLPVGWGGRSPHLRRLAQTYVSGPQLACWQVTWERPFPVWLRLPSVSEAGRALGNRSEEPGRHTRAAPGAAPTGPCQSGSMPLPCGPAQRQWGDSLRPLLRTRAAGATFHSGALEASQVKQRGQTWILRAAAGTQPGQPGL